jgi:hypothetical protein
MDINTWHIFQSILFCFFFFFFFYIRGNLYRTRYLTFIPPEESNSDSLNNVQSYNVYHNNNEENQQLYYNQQQLNSYVPQQFPNMNTVDRK